MSAECDNSSNDQSVAKRFECRACLERFETAADLFDLFQGWSSPWHGMGITIAEDLSKLAHVKVSIIDEHSNFVCRLCYQRLQDACNFVSTVQFSDCLLQKRLEEISDKVWPKPIQVDKNIFSSSMEVEVKQEVISDEENERFTADEGCRDNFSEMEIKIEPEEIMEPHFQITVNGTISHEQFNQDQISLNGLSKFEHEEYLDGTIKEEQEETESEIPDLPLDCLLCLKSFNSISGLKAHVIGEHSYKTVRRKTVNGPSPQKRQTDKFTCEICKRSFSTSTDLMVHETYHNKYVCYGCRASFESFVHLTRHTKRCKALPAASLHKTLEDVKRPSPVPEELSPGTAQPSPTASTSIPESKPTRDTTTVHNGADSSMEIHLEIHSINDRTEKKCSEIKIESVDSMCTEDSQ